MNVLEILKLCSGPLVGSVIGYFTNYIAVKMLFRPLKPVKIGKCTLPFTPGIIPKRKNDIATAIGNAVGKNLFTSEDLSTMLSSEKITASVKEAIVKMINENRGSLLKDVLPSKLIDEKATNTVSDFLEEKIINALKTVDYERLLEENAVPVIKAKLNNPLIAMFLNDKTIQPIVLSLASSIENYVDIDGRIIIREKLSENIESLKSSTVENVLSSLKMDDEKLSALAETLWNYIVKNYSHLILDNIDIAETVSTKIKEMDVLELEKLILSVMKKELNSIINLGALIGLVIGIVNCFI